jgi:tetratricopeptide (TPR) repeat protein
MAEALFGGILANAVGELLADIFGERLSQQAERRALQRAIDAAVLRAEQQFAATYAAHDGELAIALAQQTRFADLPSVRAALHELLVQPFHDPQPAAEVLRRSFADVLPSRLDRARVDAAVGAFLALLGREVLYIPQLRELYALSFQKLGAESSRATAQHTAAMAEALREVQDSLRMLAAPPVPPALAAAAARPAVRHNLPQRSYSQFFGRRAELEQLARLLLPYPRSRHFLITIDGIGGVGKSALALELAYGYRDGYPALPAAERFDAIVWVSAKRTLLTAAGIQQRRQTFTTLDDLCRELAMVLDQAAILQAESGQRRGLVEQALAAQRTLLIVDNLETIDDEELLSFLRELPDPTKCIVTTRHRLDIAYPIRLTGMDHAEAMQLITGEAAAKGVTLDAEARASLYRRTGGLPLALIWSIGLISLGQSVEAVLRRLGSCDSDIARFCFDESVAPLRGRDAQRLLLALAIFERSVSRAMLGAVAGLDEDILARDDGIGTLLRLSLINQKGDRFSLLPLTHAYARDELARADALERELRERWIAAVLELARPYAVVHHLQPSPLILLEEGQHLVQLARWAEQEQRLDVFLATLPGLLVYYDISGAWGDLLAAGARGLEYGALLGDESLVPLIHSALAWVQGQQGSHADAERSIQLALEVAGRQGEIGWQCELLGRYSQVVRRAGDSARAEELCAQAIALADTMTPELARYARADLEFERGKIARDRGDFAVARELFLKAQQMFPVDVEPSEFNPERAWGMLGNVGFVLHQLGDLDEADEVYRRCLDFFRRSGGRGYTATLLVRRAALAERRGQRHAAIAYAREALELSGQLSQVQEQREASLLLARLEVDPR